MDELSFNEAYEQVQKNPQREEVLHRLLLGEKDEQIAESMRLHPGTVRRYIADIYPIFNLSRKSPKEPRPKRGDLIYLFRQYKPELVDPGLLARFASTSKVPPFQESDDVSSKSEASYALADVSHRKELDGKKASIRDRSIYMVFDRSGTLARKDPDTDGQSRRDYLLRSSEAHAYRILSQKPEQKICDEIFVSFFSFKKKGVKKDLISIKDASELEALFEQAPLVPVAYLNEPLNQCIDDWLEKGRKNNQGVFFVIYTDGLDDEMELWKCIERVCNLIESGEISDESLVRFIVLGIGGDVDREKFQALDENRSDVFLYDITVFALLNEVEDILEPLRRELTH